MVSSAIAVDQLGLASDPTFPISCGNYHWSSLQTDWGKFPSPSSLHQLSFRSQWVCPPPWLPAPFRRCWADYEALCFLSEVPLPSCFLPHLQGPQVLRFLERGGISIRQVCKNTGKQNVGMLLSRVVSTQLSKLSGNTGFWVNMYIYWCTAYTFFWKGSHLFPCAQTFSNSCDCTPGIVYTMHILRLKWVYSLQAQKL